MITAWKLNIEPLQTECIEQWKALYIRFHLNDCYLHLIFHELMMHSKLLFYICCCVQCAIHIMFSILVTWKWAKAERMENNLWQTPLNPQNATYPRSLRHILHSSILFVLFLPMENKKIFSFLIFFSYMYLYGGMEREGWWMFKADIYSSNEYNSPGIWYSRLLLFRCLRCCGIDGDALTYV